MKDVQKVHAVMCYSVIFMAIERDDSQRVTTKVDLNSGKGIFCLASVPVSGTANNPPHFQIGWDLHKLTY